MIRISDEVVRGVRVETGGEDGGRRGRGYSVVGRLCIQVFNVQLVITTL